MQNNFIGNATMRGKHSSYQASVQQIAFKAAHIPKTYIQNAGNLILAVVCAKLDVRPEDLKKRSRGKADICLARQCAMYLMHTALSCSYCEVAGFFTRDRTTVSHACRLIEDLRDDSGFERQIVAMEGLILAAINLTSSAAFIQKSVVMHDGQ